MSATLRELADEFGCELHGIPLESWRASAR
jgi:hypothetical protein